METPSVKSRFNRTLLWVYLILIAIIGISAYIIIHNVKQSLLLSAGKNLQSIARYKSEEIQHWMNERKGDAFVLNHSHKIKAELNDFLDHLKDKEKKSSIDSFLNPLENYYNYQDIILTDSSGIIYTSLKEKVRHLGPESETMIRTSFREKNYHFSDFYYCSRHKSVHIDFYAPVYRFSGDPAGPRAMILLRVNPETFLYPLLQSWPVSSRTSETLLIRKQNDSVIYLNELRQMKGTALKLKFPVTNPELPSAMAARGKAGIVQGKDYRNTEVIAYITHIPGTPWFMVNKTDLEEVLVPMKIWTITTLIFSSFLVIFIGFIIKIIINQRRRDHFKGLYELELQKEALSKHYEYLLKYANDIILLTDGEHHIIDCNEKAVQVYGYSREELLNMKIHDLVAPEYSSTLEGRVKQIMTQDGILLESAHQRKDGSIFPIEISARSISIDNNTYIQSINRDITERKLAEKTLMESENRYRLLFSTMGEGFALHDIVCNNRGEAVDYRFLDINPAFERITGLKSHEIIGKHVTKILPDIEKEWIERYGHVALTGETITFEQYNANLDRFYRVMAFSPSRNQFAVLFEDVTEARKIQEEIKQLNLELEQRVRDRTAALETANKELESFSYSVSHDLRAPLRSLDGFSQALIEDHGENLNEQGKNYLKRIRAASQKMAKLIDDLLNLSRISRQTIKIEVIDLSNMANTVCRDLRHDYPDKKFIVEINPGMEISADESLLRIALQNLIGNAFKFSSKGKEPHVCFGITDPEPGNEKEFFIRDNGAGFDMKYADKLFGVFQRLHTLEEFPGTGIGLTIVQRIIQRHGGRIRAESEINAGTVFYFRLPTA